MLDHSLPIPRNASLSMGVGLKNTLLSMVMNIKTPC